MLSPSVSIRVHPWFLALILFVPTAFAEVESSTKSMEQLVLAATRYGSTAERRAQKEQARQELFAMKPETLHYLLANVHLENVGIQVMVQELVDQMTADDAVPVLMEFVGAERPETRRTAAFYAGFYPSAASHAQAIRPLLDEEKTRNAAIRTLGKWHSSADVKTIAGFLNDPKERTRIAAANALRDINDARAVPYLIDALNDPMFTVRNTAQRAIASFKKRAEEDLLSALPVAQGHELRAIVQLLGGIRSSRAYRPLKNLAKHEDPYVRAEAAEALKTIKTPLVDRIF